MGKKIKINETQFNSILNILTENENINNVLQNLIPNKSIKIIDAKGQETIFKIVSYDNDVFFATDESGFNIIKFKTDSLLLAESTLLDFIKLSSDDILVFRKSFINVVATHNDNLGLIVWNSFAQDSLNPNTF
jgi:hypothetical protein